MTIIHNSLFARASNKDYLGNWNLLLGNILEFLLDYEIAVDWDKLYTIFNEILYLIFDYPHKHYTFKYFEV